MSTPQPGSRYILRRPSDDKGVADSFWLVEVGAGKPPRPYTSDSPADQIELKLLGYCDKQGKLELEFYKPYSYFVAPGLVLDTRHYTPVPVMKKEAA